MTEILRIQEIYQSVEIPVSGISELSNALSAWYAAYPKQNYLHPCVIEGRAALVCQQNLSVIAPHAYAELHAIAAQYQIYLKESRRSQQIDHGGYDRRNKKLIVLTFCMNLLATSRLVTADELVTHTMVAAYSSSTNSSMQLVNAIGSDGKAVISLRHAALPTAQQVLEVYEKDKMTMQSDPQAERVIKNFLIGSYQAEANDPTYIDQDLTEIAHYYAEYPAVIQLLEQFQEKKVILKFKANNWQTQAWGTENQVNSVTVYFDTRIGAERLLNDANCNANPACSIAPADALLHELLHAKLMLLESQHFIEGGGMLQTLYPFEHEREVIDRENQLYTEMNHEDGMYRPIRHQHIGDLVHVGCAVCLPTELVAKSE
ncbi:hypothetical protein [Methylomonas sp. AM2-LC]|uniref:hypothetical protein n=1 Tax=Methylomonas sp. AM2-LC TaxID=3153301 RepID=UPI003267D207